MAESRSTAPGSASRHQDLATIQAGIDLVAEHAELVEIIGHRRRGADVLLEPLVHAVVEGGQIAVDDRSELRLYPLAGNVGLTEGTLPAALQEVKELVQPEAVYIGPDEGQRCATIVFDLQDSSDIPAITEPFFQKVNASAELLPVMNQDDLRAGMAKLG